MLRNQPLDWQINAQNAYVPLAFKGNVVGFVTPESGERILKILNHEESSLKALQLACQDLLGGNGVTPEQIRELMKKYIAMTQRPKGGPLAIAALLRDRQEELDLGTAEFMKFCDSYKLSERSFRLIFAGKPIADDLLPPLARILGKSVEDLTQIRDSGEEDSLDTF